MSDVFQTRTVSNGEYLWSNPNNWSEGVPANGENATISLSSGQIADDDLPSLTLSAVSLTSHGEIFVTGNSLGVGTIVNGGGNGLELEVYSGLGASTPVTITVGSITGGGGDYIANGQDASFVDTSPTDPGALYGAYDGGTVLLHAAPASTSGLLYDGLGTIALENPGTKVAAVLEEIRPGDVLELPGTTVSSLSFGVSSLTIATNAGTTTFSNFFTLYPVTGATTAIDPNTGLEAITFIGPDLFEDNVSASSGSLEGDYLWSNPGNWSDGVVPVNGDSVTFVGTSLDTSIDDIAALSLSSLTLTGTGFLDVSGSSLGIGNLVDAVGIDAEIRAIELNGAPPVTVTAGSITGANGYYEALGTHASFLDNSPTDPGARYFVYDGGTVLLNAAPAAGSYMVYGGLAGGTIELEHPGSLTAAPLQGLAPGDVLELPGSAVTNVNFGAGNLTITTNTGTYAFSNVSESTIVSAYTASFDSVTGLEAVTFAAPEIFKDNVAASSGSLAGDYLWSNAANWTDGVPVNGDSVTFVGTSGDKSVDDLAALFLNSLTLTGSGGLQVSEGSLGIGTVVNDAGSGISGYVTPGAATPVTITVGSITGAGGLYSADGENVSFVDNSPTDPGADYQAYYGATVFLNATPAAGSSFEYFGTGTIDLEHPGAVTDFQYQIGMGDVLELPGTTVSSASFSASSLTITTNTGTYRFTVSGDGSVLATGYTAEFDPRTGLEAITFIEPDTFEDHVKASSGSFAGDYLWSNPENWSDGVVPVNGDSVTFVGTSGDTSVDDLAALSLSSLTLTGSSGLQVSEGSLGIGTVVNDAGYGISGYVAAGSATPVTITVGSITGAGGLYSADGENVSFIDHSPTDPGADYQAYYGGTVLLNATPAAGSSFEYFGTGTIELEHPGAVTDFQYQIGPGDVLELPGTTVSSASFAAESLTIATNAGTYAVTLSGDGSDLATGYTAEFDPSTGLEAITFTRTDTFEDHVSVSSGSLAGDYLWSNESNWTSGVPVNDDAVTFVGNANDTSVDDIAALSLSSLTLTGTGALEVSGGSLGIGNLAHGVGVNYEIQAIELNGAPPVTVTAGSITGAGGIYEAFGTHASFLDNSPTDPGGSYFAYAGGTVLLNAAPAAGSYLEYDFFAGTIELEHPGSLTAAPLQRLAPGDVLELPGSAVTNVNFGAGNLTITTNTGTYAFSNVSESTIVSAYTASFDSVTGLEAVTFAAPEIFKDNVAASSGSLAGDYLWSNAANWTDGVPLNGDAVTFVGTGSDTSVDDLTPLSLSSLTLTGEGDLYVFPGGSLAIGTAVNAAGNDSGIIADDGGPDAATPVSVTVGSITGAGGIYESGGGNASFVDNSPTDPGATYFPFVGGTLVLNAAPVASSYLEYLGAGTLELEHPGSLIAAPLQGIEPGDVLELPGTAVSSGSFDLGPSAPGGGSFTITTTAGTYTFSNVTDRSLVSDFTANFDSVTGLEAITFTGPYLQDLVVPEGQTDIIFSGNTVSNPELAGGTLVLDSGSTVTGNISFAGTGGELIIEPNADGSTTVPGNEITGFAPGDTIKLAGISFTGTGGPYGAAGEDTYTVASAGTLTIDAAGTIYTVQIEGATIGQHDFVLADDLGITEVACFAAGTRIRTPEGEVRIEALRVGDLVTTAAGDAPILWLGHRAIDCTRHPNPQAVWPVLIRQGAFAEGAPARDLFVSPRHALYVHGLLMQAETLVNGATILQVQVPCVTYWHVELARHGLVFAEGMMAETYLDNGNRCAFINGGEFIEAHPDFRPKHWTETCVPLVFDGPEMQAAKTALLARAAELGHCITQEDGLHIIADGQRVDPIRLSETRAAFVLPAGCEEIMMVSRTFIPAQINPLSQDQRTLGACVQWLQIDGDDIALNDNAAFGAGWHYYEPRENSPGARWTTGATPIPSSTRLVVMDFAGQGYYWTRNETAELGRSKQIMMIRG